MKANAEKHRLVRESPFKPVDVVLVKRDGHVGKFSSPFDPRPLKVVEVRSLMITAERGSQRVVRNSSRFAILRGSHVGSDDPDMLNDDDVLPVNNRGNAPAPRRNPFRNQAPPRYLRDYYR